MNNLLNLKVLLDKIFRNIQFKVLRKFLFLLSLPYKIPSPTEVFRRAPWGTKNRLYSCIVVVGRG